MLSDHLQNGLVIFCGAGVSMVPPTCLPSWWEMNEQVVLALAAQVETICGKPEADRIAAQINERRNSRRFPPEFQAELISKRFGHEYFKVLECLDGDTPNAVHLAIAALAKAGYVRAIVTTNFDRVIEAAFQKMEVPLNTCFSAEHFEALADQLGAHNTAAPCQLLKLHGSVDDHMTLVDTLAQRMRGLSSNIIRCIEHLLKNHHWLFMGFSGGDIEGNKQYLSLRKMAADAAGFTWLVRDASKKEPIEAVVNLKDLYGEKASTPRGELPAWFFSQFDAALPDHLPIPDQLDEAALQARKQHASQSIHQHTRAWANDVGPIRSALILADMLRRSISDPQTAIVLLEKAYASITDDQHAGIVVANSLSNLYIDAGALEKARTLVEDALSRLGEDAAEHRAGLLGTLGRIEEASGNLEAALHHFDALYEFSRQVGDKNQVSIALHNRAMVLSSLGRMNEARESYEAELAIVRELGDAVAQSQVLNNLGDLLRLMGLYDESIAMLDQSIQLRERLGDDRGVANALGNQAASFLQQGALDKAEASYKKILAIFQRIENLHGVVNTTYNLGDVSRWRRAYAQAAQYYGEGLALAVGPDFLALRAAGLWKTAAIHRETDHLDEAQPLYEEALKIFQSIAHLPGEADVLNELGVLKWQRDELDDATTLIEKAITLYEQLNQPTDRGAALNNLGLIYQKRGMPEKALQCLQEKLSIAAQAGAPADIASAHYNMGATLHQMHRVEEALASFDQAQQIYRHIGLLSQAIEILALIGNIVGHAGQVEQSLYWFDEAIPLAKTEESRTLIAQRLYSVLERLHQNGYQQYAEPFVKRMQAVGAEIDIRGSE